MVSQYTAAIGKQIVARHKAGETQKAIASEFGVTSVTLRRWARDNDLPILSTAGKTAKKAAKKAKPAKKTKKVAKKTTKQ